MKFDTWTHLLAIQWVVNNAHALENDKSDSRKFSLEKRPCIVCAANKRLAFGAHTHTRTSYGWTSFKFWIVSAIRVTRRLHDAPLWRGASNCATVMAALQWLPTTVVFALDAPSICGPSSVRLGGCRSSVLGWRRFRAPCQSMGTGYLGRWPRQRTDEWVEQCSRTHQARTDTQARMCGGSEQTQQKIPRQQCRRARVGTVHERMKRGWEGEINEGSGRRMPWSQAGEFISADFECAFVVKCFIRVIYSRFRHASFFLSSARWCWWEYSRCLIFL